MYTSAGAGPVSLGLVTVFALLLLTCRGQCKGDMTNAHISDARTHTRSTLAAVHSKETTRLKYLLLVLHCN